jgi:hypothetical protein
MKRCVDCGQGLANEARRCNECMTIQPSNRFGHRRITAPYLVLRWALLTLFVTVVWAIIGFDSHESMLFAIVESAFGAGIVIALDQLLDRGL